MSETTDRFRDWDAAYVLGALSTEDRRAFERHLASCPECAADVAELAPPINTTTAELDAIPFATTLNKYPPGASPAGSENITVSWLVMRSRSRSRVFRIKVRA